MPAYAPDTPQLPLPDEGYGSFDYWLEQVEAAEERRKDFKETDWDRNVQSYLGHTLSLLPTTDTITVPKDFSNVERKKAELFFQNPEINLQPKMPGLEDAVNIFQAVLNHQLGPAGVDAGTMMAECTFDACMTALMVSKIGYEHFQDGLKPVQVGEEPVPQPPRPGDVLGLSDQPAPMMQPIMAQVPNTIYERYFWERVSPARVLIPSAFNGFCYDKAPWLGFEFEDDLEVIKHRYGLTDDYAGKMVDEEHLLLSEPNRAGRLGQDNRVRGREIWYRASLYDPKVTHPEQLRYLVLLDGLEKPAKHEDSPYQQRGPDGKLRGMKGFPVHLGAIRYVSDSAYPAAEATISRPQVQELGKSRTQMLKQRDLNVPMRLVDVPRVGGEGGMTKIRSGVWQGIIGINGLDANNPPVLEIARSSYPPEDFQFNTIIDRDLQEVWSFGANQRGLETAERKTATEIRNIQANTNSRLDYERRHIINFYVRGAEKLGALLQLFADDTDYVEIVGQDNTRRLAAWNKQAIAGEFVYDAKPDSAVRLDAAQEFKDVLEMYNITGKDPHTNRVELLTKLARLRNLDPARFVVPQLPAKGPDPASVGFSFKGEDLDPRNPMFPIVIEILSKNGYQVSAQAIQAAQQHAQQQGQILNELAAPGGAAGAPSSLPGAAPATHGGAATPMERLSQHSSERSRSGEISGPPTTQSGKKE